MNDNALSKPLISTVINTYLKNTGTLDSSIESLSSNYSLNSFKQFYSIFSIQFSKVLSLHYDSFKRIFKSESVELSSRVSAFILATFRLSLMRLACWYYMLNFISDDDRDIIYQEDHDGYTADATYFLDTDLDPVLYSEFLENISTHVGFDTHMELNNKEIGLVAEYDLPHKARKWFPFVFFFVDMLDLEIDFLNGIVLNLRQFVFNKEKDITNFLYSTYCVYGKVPLLPEFHLVVTRTVLPYILRNFLVPHK